MRYTVEVDQSIKIEQAGATVLAFSNGIAWAILIPPDVKTETIRRLIYRKHTNLEARLIVFAAGLYLLLRDRLAELGQVIIDVEYQGQEANIKAALLRYIWRTAPDFGGDRIIFRRVGKKSPAHAKARAVRTGRDRQYRRVTLEELLEVLGQK